MDENPFLPEPTLLAHWVNALFFPILLFSLIVAGPIFALVQRKKDGRDTLPRLGLIVGFVPIAVSAMWDLFFFLHYHSRYDSVRVENLAATYKFIHYPILAIIVPLSANLVWKKSEKSASLMMKRLLLLAAFFLESVFCESIPGQWTYTYLLVLPTVLFMAIGFAFLRRSASEKIAGNP